MCPYLSQLYLVTQHVLHFTCKTGYGVKHDRDQTPWELLLPHNTLAKPPCPLTAPNRGGDTVYLQSVGSLSLALAAGTYHSCAHSQSTC